MAVIFRYKNGRIIPIKVDEEQTTNDYMNDKIRNKGKETFDNIEANSPEEYKQKRKEYVNKNIKFKQTDYPADYYKINAMIDNKIAGVVRYSIEDGQIYVDFIDTEDNYLRSGVATNLYKQLQSKTPNKDIVFGDLTPEGKALLNKIGTIKKNKNGKYYGRIKM